MQDFQSSMSAAAGQSRCRPGLRQGWAMAYWSGSIQLGLEWTEELDSLGPENAGSVDTGGCRNSVMQMLGPGFCRQPGDP